MAKKASKKTSARDRCPMCGEPVGTGQILTCVTCGDEGSTNCCITGGVGTQCINCDAEEEEGDDA